MIILNQTKWDLEERILFALHMARVHPSMVHVMYLPHPRWPKDGKHTSGKTMRRHVSQNWCPTVSRVNIYLPHRFRPGMLKRYGQGLNLGRHTDEDSIMFILGHEAYHCTERPWCGNEKAADKMGLKVLKAWQNRA